MRRHYQLGAGGGGGGDDDGNDDDQSNNGRARGAREGPSGAVVAVDSGRLLKIK